MDSEEGNCVEVKDVERLERQFLHEVASSGAAAVSDQTKFDYAWALVHSRDRRDIQRGVNYFEDLTKVPTRHREALYFLAFGQTRLEHFAAARGTIERLLAEEPHNAQAQQLLADVEQKLSRDATLGLALTGTAALVVVGAVALTAGLLLGKK